MPESTTFSKLFDILKGEAPLLDVRSPIEFNRGAIPGSINLPLLDDEQRRVIGICYRKSGRSEAIKLGHQLISGNLKSSRIKSWKEFFEKNPKGIICCYRGGLRSRITQEWLASVGIDCSMVSGGYKALRRSCINILDSACSQNKIIVVSGKTGTSKTEILTNISSAIDLEGIASHRGSAFGRRLRPQPTQINFENQIAMDLLRIDSSLDRPIFIEDESSSIGSLSIPTNLFYQMKNAPIALIEASIEKRVDKILKDYIISNYHEFHYHDPKNSLTLFSEFLLSSLWRIKKRLGEKNYRAVKKNMDDILEPPNTEEAMKSHQKWIYTLITEYYDPMYEYQLEKKSHRIIFRGDKTEFLRWSREAD